MTISYRVVDLRNDVIDAQEVLVGGRSPEDAARQILGIDVVRSGSKKDLVARVYWQTVGHPMYMVRLYRKVADRPAEQRPSGTPHPSSR